MKQKYLKWIADNVQKAYGTCKETSKKMQAAFPELMLVRGHYYCPIWGERAHWWLVDEGEIVDPTASQFPSKGTGKYVPWIEGSLEPTGICPNCSSRVYNGNTCCSEFCSLEYAAYCQNPLKPL